MIAVDERARQLIAGCGRLRLSGRPCRPEGGDLQQHSRAHIWGPIERKETSYLRVYIAQLRQKLERDPAHPRHLITEAGMGYRFRT